MAEIHFVEAEEVLRKTLEEGSDLLRRASQRYEELLCEDIQEEGAAVSTAYLLSVEDECFLYAVEVISGISECLPEDASVAFAYHGEVLYARIFDGERYVFPIPIMLTEDADAVEACISLAEYAEREMIPLIISDVPRDELTFLCSIFPHVDAFTYEDDDDTFYIKVNNECDMLEYVPSIELAGITLDELRDSDKERYATLCRDRELNKYWGYDADCDNPEGNPDFYLDTVRREFNDGVAITLAVREGGELVGEATIYGFDFKGGASIAVRVMREYHSRGIGSRATKALIELAREIGLSTLRTEVLRENVNSVKMTSKYMTLEKYENGKVHFTLSL